MAGWKHAMAEVNGIRMHYVTQGSGLLLLHSWPQTWYAWRKLIPALAEQYTVVAPDLRGYGRTDKPSAGYDKRTMASDIRALAQALGHERVLVVGHNRGARVAHRYGLDYPQEVAKLALLDILPTRAIFEGMDASMARGVANWLFLLTEKVVGLELELALQDRSGHRLVRVVRSKGYRTRLNVDVGARFRNGDRRGTATINQHHPLPLGLLSQPPDKRLARIAPRRIRQEYDLHPAVAVVRRRIRRRARGAGREWYLVPPAINRSNHRHERQCADTGQERQ
jgi:pimeloyl-ACP methyl ester carboxylesterase